jgi:hypothetical protein
MQQQLALGVRQPQSRPNKIKHLEQLLVRKAKYLGTIRSQLLYILIQ